MEIKTIVLHHTATPGIGTGGEEWEAIKKACQSKRGGNYICDYHWGIGPTGILFPGQPDSLPCWHCGVDAINNESLAVACIGNFEEYPMSIQQEIALIVKVLEIKRKHPQAGVRLHKEIVATLCPGRFFPTRKVLDALYARKGFRDIPESHIFYPAIIAIVSRGIMNGDSEGTFRPDDPVTRGELAQAFWNWIRK